MRWNCSLLLSVTPFIICASFHGGMYSPPVRPFALFSTPDAVCAAASYGSSTVLLRGPPGLAVSSPMDSPGGGRSRRRGSSLPRRSRGDADLRSRRGGERRGGGERRRLGERESPRRGGDRESPRRGGERESPRRGGDLEELRRPLRGGGLRDGLREPLREYEEPEYEDSPEPLPSGMVCHRRLVCHRVVAWWRASNPVAISGILRSPLTRIPTNHFVSAY